MYLSLRTPFATISANPNKSQALYRGLGDTSPVPLQREISLDSLYHCHCEEC